MAKPNPLFPATSSSTHPHPPRHTHTRPASPSSPRQANIHSTRPSSTVVALLAAVAASSSAADGRPLSTDSQPLDFLCPILASDSLGDCPSSSNVKLDDQNAHPQLYHLSPTPTRKKRGAIPAGSVPPKFVQGSDGLWRKEPTWSLYGSTHCDCEDSPSITQTAIPEIDDQVDPTTTSSQAHTTSPSPTSTDMTASLPPGWDGSEDRKDLPPYILALSICLAVFICGTIFGCVAWRRKRRALIDHEKRMQKKANEVYDSDLDSEELKCARSHQRMWTKASARWKAGVRVSARRRRRRTAALTPQDTEPKMPTETLPRDTTVSIHSVGSSAHFQPDDTTIIPLRHEDTPQDPHASSSLEVPTEVSRFSLPPQYPQDSIERLSLPEVNGAVVGCRRSSAEVDTPPLDDEDIPYSAVGGHVATDDKTILSRMADFASSPPMEAGVPLDASGNETSIIAGPSVPVLEQLEQDAVDLLSEEIGTFRSEGRSTWTRSVIPDIQVSHSELCSHSDHAPVPIYSREPSPHPRPRTPVFPAPPTKAQLFYEYPSSFEEDVEGIEPLPVPSAPPFEFASAPSAPPHDAFETSDVSAVACAPPFIDEEEEAAHLGLFVAPVSSGLSRATSTSPTAEDEIRDQPRAAVDDYSVPHVGHATGCSSQAQTQSGIWTCSCATDRSSASSAERRPAFASSPSSSEGTMLSPPDYLP
ncbi:hypothetical protein BC835DRAFT_1419397 [Cytidiella melzeri]|nr:hypothetical protein BC835DRAFT_1419397 [Cytidiella melzeri]